MSDRKELNKARVINAIKRNITILNSVVLLIVFILFFMNVKFLFRILDYVPSLSIVAMVTIMSGLVLISLYLAKAISANSIKELEAYDSRLNSTLNSLQKEILERKQAEMQIEYQALYDHMTTLPNRNLLLSRLKRVAERPDRHENYTYAVLFIDLDHFKIVNDSLGHFIGDQLLKAVAQILENCIRTIDTVARFGGDEFVILLDDINDVSDSIRIARRVHEELSQPFLLEGHQVFTSASIGIALSSSEHKNKEDIIRDADIAMYKAKANGRARYEVFDKYMHKIIMNRLKLEVELRRAVQNKEFLVYYQPIVSMSDLRIVGAEALVRWLHPEHGFIPPVEFIPLAEDIGLIASIGEFVLRTACTDNKSWHDAGFQNLHIDVNFSSKQFHNRNIPEVIKRIIDETAMDANLLDIEITESIAMEDYSIDILHDLNAMGINTSVDDFGTGHSSLGVLKKFPINTIKIDKSFIADIARDTDAETIVRAIIDMAHALKIKVVAEGVEMKEQLAILRSDHCDEIQGYLCSPPVSAADFTALLHKGMHISTEIM